ncbi:MAG: hypothetical protein ACRC62_09980 [Microcoleus sp.]
MRGHPWTTAEELLLESLEGSYIGREFVARYQYQASRNNYHFRSYRAIEAKAARMGITMGGGIFDSFSCLKLANALGINHKRVRRWIRDGLPAARIAANKTIILIRDFIPWAQGNINRLLNIDPDRLRWVTNGAITPPQRPKYAGQPVRRMSDGRTFINVTAAAKACWIQRGNIYTALRTGGRAAGSTWEIV